MCRSASVAGVHCFWLPVLTALLQHNIFQLRAYTYLLNQRLTKL